MAPAKYGDLGKAAKDLFNKDYAFGQVKGEISTTTSSGVAFKSTGSLDMKSGGVAGDLETKYLFKDYGLSVTEKWTTKNILSSEFSVEDKLAKGVKLSVNSNVSPNSGAVDADVSLTYAQDHFHANASVDVFKGPTMSANAVFSYENFLGGYDFGYSVGKGNITKSNFALGYAGKDYTLHTAVNDGSKVAFSVHQRVNNKLSMAAQLGFSKSSKNSAFSTGIHYKLDKDASLKAKVDNDAQFGVSYAQVIRPGVKATLSAGIDCKNLAADSHKVGLAFVFSP